MRCAPGAASNIIQLRFSANLIQAVLAEIREAVEHNGDARGRIISFFTFKGGVGKTTIAATVGWALSMRQQKRGC